MDLDAIAVYVKVVEAGSFSGAARLLKMPKTTVSAKVANLEKSLGVTLIQRTTRKLNVTNQGMAFFKRCVTGLREIELGEAELLAEQEEPRGLLRVTAPSDFGLSLIPQIVGDYLDKYPDVNVDLIVTNRIIDLVGESVDLAFRAGELKDSTLRARRFIENEISLWASPQYIKKYGAIKQPSDLNNHHVIAHSSFKVSGLELTDGKKKFFWQPKPRIAVDDFATLKSLISMNQGIGLLPKFMVHSGREKLVALLPSYRVDQAGAIHIVYPGQKYASTKVRRFIEVATKYAEKLK